MSGRSPWCRAGGPGGGGKRPGEGRSVGWDALQSFLIKLIKFFCARSAPPPPAHPSRAPRGPPRTPLGGWGRVGAGGGASPSGSPPRKPTFSGGRDPGARAQTPVPTDPARRSGSVGVPHPPAGPRIPQIEVIVEIRNFRNFREIPAFPGIPGHSHGTSVPKIGLLMRQDSCEFLPPFASSLRTGCATNTAQTTGNLRLPESD